MKRTEEEWRAIPGLDGRYSASSEGRVRSESRRIAKRHAKTGAPFSVCWQGRVLRPCVTPSGHLAVVLGLERDGHMRTRLVHHLVYEAFRGQRDPKLDVRHLDGDPANNRLENLAQGTRSENILDVVRAGRAWRKLSRAQATEIRAALRNGAAGAELARRFCVSQATISAIKVGRTHVL